MSSQRSQLQPAMARKFRNMFCTKDGRQYFDKSFKTLFRNNRPEQILAIVQDHAANRGIEDMAESSGESVLHLAAKYGITEVAEYLVSSGCEVDARSGECGWTPLMLAAAYGYTDVCGLLLDANADVFATDFLGESALHSATTWTSDPFDYAHLDLFLNKLKSLGLDVEQLASMLIKANSPMYFVVQLDDAELTRTLRERGYAVPKSAVKDDMLLLDAVALMNFENVKFALELMDLDLDFVDEFEYAPLHYAVENGDREGNVSIIEHLLDKGADVNVRGVGGMTPLFAVFNGFLANERKKHCIYFLLHRGADPQVLDDNDDTVIDYAMDAAIEDYDETLLDPVMSHLALQEALGVPIAEKLRRQIDEEENLKYYYRSCTRCLEDMRKIVISGPVTMYKLLSESEEQITQYLRNVEVAKSFVHTVFDTNFYYRYVINKRFIKVMNIIKSGK